MGVRPTQGGAGLTFAEGDTTGADAEGRRRVIVESLLAHFGDLLAADPDAFRRRFRKMAESPFAFFRGSAPLFYADMAGLDDQPADPRAARVWIQGDLHAENFGTYLNAQGRLVFDVNDFDEAYIGHFGWDVRRLAASLALIGYAKAFSDRDITAVVTACGHGYAGRVYAFAAGASAGELTLTLDTTQGPVHAALERARRATRSELLQALTVVEGCQRRFRRGPGARDIDADSAADVEQAFRGYLSTLPEADSRGVAGPRIKGRGGGQLRDRQRGATRLHAAAPGRYRRVGESDLVISMKQANVCVPSRVVRDARIQGYFEHHGHGTVLSQRALRAHADPWLGYTVLRGVGQVVKEFSPYETDLDWREINDVETMAAVAAQLGQAVAKVHSVADVHGDHGLVPFPAEEAIAACIGDDHEGFAQALADFALTYSEVVREDHRLFVDAFRNHQIPGLS